MLRRLDRTRRLCGDRLSDRPFDRGCVSVARRVAEDVAADTAAAAAVVVVERSVADAAVAVVDRGSACYDREETHSEQGWKCHYAQPYFR